MKTWLMSKKPAKWLKLTTKLQIVYKINAVNRLNLLLNKLIEWMEW